MTFELHAEFQSFSDGGMATVGRIRKLFQESGNFEVTVRGIERYFDSIAPIARRTFSSLMIAQFSERLRFADAFQFTY